MATVFEIFLAINTSSTKRISSSILIIYTITPSSKRHRYGLPITCSTIMFLRELGEKLQNYPRVTQLLKSYNADYVRKVASVFEKEHIDAYLSLEDNSPFLVRKLAVTMALCGGLRTAELRELNFESVVKKGDVYDVK